MNVLWDPRERDWWEKWWRWSGIEEVEIFLRWKVEGRTLT
jgi:hypothetical protein